MAVYRNINVRSPFYSQLATTEPMVDLEVRVWSGTVAEKPTEANYTMTKEQTGGQATFEVAELIRDHISQTTSVVSGTSFVELVMDDRVNTPNSTIYLASEGYKLYTEGVQHNGNSFESDFVALPEYSDGKYKVLVPHQRYTSFMVYTQPQNATDWKYTVNKTDGTSYDVELYVPVSSQSYFQVIQLGKEIASIDLDLNGTLATVEGVFTDCTKYNVGDNATALLSGDISNSKPIECMYTNKFGGKTFFPFTLKHIESIEVSSDGFQRHNLNYDGMTTNNGKHAYRKRITGSKQRFVANTEWLDQYFVKHIEELIMSEYVWLNVRTIGNSFIPVNVKTKKFERKNHLNDKLIQYSIEFEMASEYLNTVR